MTRYKIDGNETFWFYEKPNFEGLLFNAVGPVGWTRVNSRYNDKVSSVELILRQQGKGEQDKIKCTYVDIHHNILFLYYYFFEGYHDIILS
jgi:hypothetical protein